MQCSADQGVTVVSRAIGIVRSKSSSPTARDQKSKNNPLRFGERRSEPNLCCRPERATGRSGVLSASSSLGRASLF